MPYKIENIGTEIWHRIMKDLEAAGFKEVYRYGGMDAGIDYGRHDFMSRADGELVVFEWSNWTEGEITAAPSRLESLREKYRLREPVEV